MHDVTRGMDFRMNRQVLIGYRPAVLVTVESFEKIDCRPDSDTYDDHIRFNAFSRFQNYALDRSVAIETLDTRTKDELHAVCFVFLLKECADLVSKSFLERHLIGSDDRHEFSPFTKMQIPNKRQLTNSALLFPSKNQSHFFQ